MDPNQASTPCLKDRNILAEENSSYMLILVCGLATSLST